MPSERKIKRLENKKNKLKAYLELATSNDDDREKRKQAAIELSVKEEKKESSTESESDIEPQVKRQKIDKDDAQQDKSSSEEVVEEIKNSVQVKPERRRLTDSELHDLNMRKRQRDKEKNQWPLVYLTGVGEAASLSLDTASRTPLFMGDIQSLIMYGMISVLAPYKPRWCTLVRPAKSSHVIAVVVDGVSLKDIAIAAATDTSQKILQSDSDLVKDEAEQDLNDANFNCEALKTVFPRTYKDFPFRMELLAPSQYSASPVEELINIPLSVTAKKQLEKEFGNLKKAVEKGLIHNALAHYFPTTEAPSKRKDAADFEKEAQKSKQKKEDAGYYDTQTLPSTDNYDRRKLLLTPIEFIEFGFPITLRGAPGFQDPDYVFTKKKYDPVTSNSPMFGVDCEMCMTSIRQLELTMISIVNEKKELIYHSLVKPKNRIINYLTRFSGVTKEMLQDVTTSLDEVQRDIQNLLPADAILIGQSLESDMKAMKMMHPYIIDTSVIYNITGIRTKKTSLRNLSKLFLDEVIQDGKEGHDPTEDASAALKLVQHKLTKDPHYGDVIHGYSLPLTMNNNIKYEPLQSIKEEEEENLADVPHVDTAPTKFFTNMFTHTSKQSKKCALVTTPLGLPEYERLLPSGGEKIFNVLVEPGHKQLSNKVAQVAIDVDFTIAHLKMDVRLSQCNAEGRLHTLQKLDKRLHRIYENAAPKAFIVLLFTGSPLTEEPKQRSNGAAMMCVKGIEKFRYLSST